MKNSNIQIEPRAYRVEDFCRTYGLGRTKTYALIKTGELKSVVIGGRRLIPKEAAEALLTAAQSAV